MTIICVSVRGSCLFQLLLPSDERQGRDRLELRGDALQARLHQSPARQPPPQVQRRQRRALLHQQVPREMLQQEAE
jgi:hypothetical protein